MAAGNVGNYFGLQKEMSAAIVSRPDPNQSILISIILSVVVTLILWFLQSVFHLNAFWSFLIYILILVVLFYFIMPKFNQTPQVILA